jgi:hypothetical protein
MTDHLCGYAGDRGDVLIAYVYDDIDPATRASFDAHLASCGRCRDELADLRGVRAQLGLWAPPEPKFVTSDEASAISHQPSAISHWWNAIPAWAQVAAALLFLGVAAGIANLDVRYNSDGLTVRTGWSKSAAPSSLVQDPSANVPRPTSAVTMGTEPAPWRADLAALEQQLRREFRASVVPGADRPVNASAAGVSEAEVRRLVRTMIGESERRQQNELALRVGGVFRDVKAQRDVDLVRINQSLTSLAQSNQGLTSAQRDVGAAILMNQQRLNYLINASLTK